MQVIVRGKSDGDVMFLVNKAGIIFNILSINAHYTPYVNMISPYQSVNMSSAPLHTSPGELQIGNSIIHRIRESRL